MEKKITFLWNWTLNNWYWLLVIQKHPNCNILGLQCFFARLFHILRWQNESLQSMTSKTCVLALRRCTVSQKNKQYRKKSTGFGTTNSTSLWFARKDSKTRFLLTSLLLYWREHTKASFSI